MITNPLYRASKQIINQALNFARQSSVKFNGQITRPLSSQDESGGITRPIKFQIRPTSKPTHLTIGSNINVSLDDIELQIGNERLSFNLTWLRDSCHCAECTHPSSRQRLFTIKDFKRDLFEVKDVNIISSDNSNRDEKSTICVDWSNGHRSSYSLSWLHHINNLYQKTQSGLRDQPCEQFHFPSDDLYESHESIRTSKEPWDVKFLTSAITPIDFYQLTDGLNLTRGALSTINPNRVSEMSSTRFEALHGLTRQLVRYGLAKVVNVPAEKGRILDVVEAIAYVRPTGYGFVFDVVAEPSDDINLAYSTLEFDLHSDLTYREMSPGVQLLHCIQNSASRGYSYFADALKAAQTLQHENPHLFNVLIQFPATYIIRDPYRNVKFRRHKSVLSTDATGHISDIYYSPFMLPPIGYIDDVRLFYLALDQFTQKLQDERNKFICKMLPGELFVFHNRRVLHGRSDYDASTGPRFMQGCYMDWDEVTCLHEKLNSSRNT